MKSFLILISCLIIISCNYDLKYYDNIPGTWNCNKVSGPKAYDACEDQSFQFFDNRIYRRLQSGETTNGMYKIDGNKIHFGEPGQMINSYRVLDIEGDTMRWETLEGEKFVVEFIRAENEI